MEALIFIILTLIVLFNGVGDAYFDFKSKLTSKILEETKIVLFWALLGLLINPKYANWQLIPIAYYCIKFVLTDFTWNLTARFLKAKKDDKLIGFFYTGTTSGFYSKIMKGIKAYKPLYLFLIALILTYSIFIIFRDLKI